MVFRDPESYLRVQYIAYRPNERLRKILRLGLNLSFSCRAFIYRVGVIRVAASLRFFAALRMTYVKNAPFVVRAPGWQLLKPIQTAIHVHFGWVSIGSFRGTLRLPDGTVTACPFVR